ncbi:hypothetical protein BDP27DRAFT_1356967 [Rhodocollybia butyracea]|uniref:F-box domain-containing protein n=1 Tax=Rhodocollybia butyracea TaxID=206335 RepID=A0A9P5QAR0_9AGAR|nr:hypothetical protein BDP27DRAFT_1356967 [Rhodocollybia butyracea]
MAQYLSLRRIEGPIWLAPKDITTIRACISEAQEQLTTLEFENRMNKDSWASDSELMSRKDQKIAEIASLQNIIAPVRRMPPEIVSEIFKAYCSMDHMYGMHGGLYQGTCTRITLTSVCAAWRKTAHATPELWSELKVHRSGVSSFNDADIVTQWLSRSGNLPLDLNISLRMRYRGNISEAFPDFSHRIRSLEVCLPREYFEPFTNLPKSSFPSLEKLVLDFRGRDRYYCPPELESQYIEIFLDSNQLKYVKFTEDGFSCLLLENIKFPRDTVTSLMVDAAYFNRSPFVSLYFDTLRSMNQLVHCTIEFPKERLEIFRTRPKPIILPFLQSLTLSAESDVAAGYDVAFFRCLDAPLLKDLHLVRASQNHAELVTQLAEFCTRSMVLLSSLHLSSFYGGVISGKDIIRLIAVFPSIRILRFDEADRDLDIRPLIDALIYNPARPGPLHLPNLEELYLQGHEVEQAKVCDLIRSYWRSTKEKNTGTNHSLPDAEDGTSRLRKATIRIWAHQGLDTDCLRQLVHESALHGIEFGFH